jgi:anti-sigma regulatory factor (Ser/Thr protein kinase)
MNEKKFLAELKFLHPMLLWVHDCVTTIHFSKKELLELELCLEEIFMNLAKHATKEESLEITMQIQICSNKVQITFIDQGKPFNPLKDSINPDIEKGEGVGLVLIRKICKNMTYLRKDNKNHLILIYEKPNRCSCSSC